MNVVPKDTVMGYNPNDRYSQVQYAKLHKRLQDLKDLLAKIDD